MNLTRAGSEIKLSIVAPASDDTAIAPQTLDEIDHLFAALIFPKPRGAYTLESARS